MNPKSVCDDLDGKGKRADFNLSADQFAEFVCLEDAPDLATKYASMTKAQKSMLSPDHRQMADSAGNTAGQNLPSRNNTCRDFTRGQCYAHNSCHRRHEWSEFWRPILDNAIEGKGAPVDDVASRDDSRLSPQELELKNRYDSMDKSTLDSRVRDMLNSIGRTRGNDQPLCPEFVRGQCMKHVNCAKRHNWCLYYKQFLFPKGASEPAKSPAPQNQPQQHFSEQRISKQPAPSPERLSVAEEGIKLYEELTREQHGKLHPNIRSELQSIGKTAGGLSALVCEPFKEGRGCKKGYTCHLRHIWSRHYVDTLKNVIYTFSAEPSHVQAQVPQKTQVLPPKHIAPKKAPVESQSKTIFDAPTVSNSAGSAISSNGKVIALPNDVRPAFKKREERKPGYINANNEVVDKLPENETTATSSVVQNATTSTAARVSVGDPQVEVSTTARSQAKADVERMRRRIQEAKQRSRKR